MFRGLKSILRHTDDSTSRRRERRCLPTLTGSASCLEDRVLLSGAGARAHAAEVVHHDAHKVRVEVSRRALHKDHVTMARRQQMPASAASLTAINVSGNPPTSTLASMSSSASTTGNPGSMTSTTSAMIGATPTVVTFTPTTSLPLSAVMSGAFVNTLPSAINPASVGLHVIQADFSSLRAGLSGGSGSGTGTSTTTGSGGGSTSPTSLDSLLSSLSNSTSGLTSSQSSALQSLLSSLSTSGLTTSGSSPLQSFLSGSVPTPGLTTSTGSITTALGQLGLSQTQLSQLGLSQLLVTPAMSASSTAPDAPTTGLTLAPTTGLTLAPTTGLTLAPTTGLTLAPSSNLL